MTKIFKKVLIICILVNIISFVGCNNHIVSDNTQEITPNETLENTPNTSNSAQKVTPTKHLGNNTDSTWGFGETDIYINGNPIIDATYEQIIENYGIPNEIKYFKLRPPATEPGIYEYFVLAIYDNIVFEFYKGYEQDKIFEKDKVFRFDIIGEEVVLDCGLKTGMTVNEVKMNFGDRKAYNLNELNNSVEISDIKHVLESHKPEGFYSNYSDAMIIGLDPIKFSYSTKAMSLVLLLEDNKIDRIVFGYPTSG